MSIFHKKPSVKVFSHYDVRPYVTELDPMANGQDLEWPYDGLYFFQTNKKLVGKSAALREGTEGKWHSFYPRDARFLDENNQNAHPIHFVSLGSGGNIARLGFMARNLDGPEIAACGIYNYLHGNYSNLETEILQARAQELNTLNQRGLEHNLDHMLDIILKNDSLS